MSRLLRLSATLLAALGVGVIALDLLLEPATAQAPAGSSQPPGTGLGAAQLLGVAGPGDVQLGTSAQLAVTPAAITGATTPQALTFASPIAWNMAQGALATVTVTANFTIGTPTNPILGQVYKAWIKQGGSGSYTATWPASTIFDWGAAGAPTLSTSVGKVDEITLICVNAATPLFYASAKLGF
jgi:hypothetical protein